MNALRFQVLNIINDICKDDNFKVIDINDILINLPSEMDVKETDVFAIIDELAFDGEIDLKYRDEEDICLAMALKGRRIIKKARENEERIREKREYEARLKAEEEARIIEEEKRRAEEEARRKEEEARRKAEEEDRKQAELEKAEQERIAKEKQLEEIKKAIEEAQTQRKTKKNAKDLEQQAELLIQEIEQVEGKKLDIIEEKAEEEIEEIIEEEESVQEMVVPAQAIITTEPIDYNRIIKSVGKKAFRGGVLGGIIASALSIGAYYAINFLLG